MSAEIRIKIKQTKSKPHKIFSKIWLHESSEGCIHAALKIKDRNDHQDSNVRKCVKREKTYCTSSAEPSLYLREVMQHRKTQELNIEPSVKIIKGKETLVEVEGNEVHVSLRDSKTVRLI